MGFPKSVEPVSHVVCAPEWTFKCFCKTGSHMLDCERSHAGVHRFIYMHVLLSKPSLSLFSANAYSHILHCARWRRYGFCSPLRPSPPLQFCGSDPAVWPVLDYWGAHCPHTKPVSCPQKEKLSWPTLRKLFLHRCRPQMEPVGTCFLEEKNNFVSYAWEKKKNIKISALNLQQRVSTRPPRHCWDFGLSQHFSSCAALKVVALTPCSGGTSATALIPNEVLTPSFKIQTPHKGICLARDQNPVTTAVVNILWYLRHKGISLQGSWDWYV